MSCTVHHALWRPEDFKTTYRPSTAITRTTDGMYAPMKMGMSPDHAEKSRERIPANPPREWPQVAKLRLHELHHRRRRLTA